MPPARSCFESDCAGLLSCNSLQLKRRAELRWKPAHPCIIGVASFLFGSIRKLISPYVGDSAAGDSSVVPGLSGEESYSSATTSSNLL
jgi:hypothetical protein